MLSWGMQPSLVTHLPRAAPRPREDCRRAWHRRSDANYGCNRQADAAKIVQRHLRAPEVSRAVVVASAAVRESVRKLVVHQERVSHVPRHAQHAAELQALAARTFEDATSTTLTAAAQHQEQAINDLNSLLR